VTLEVGNQRAQAKAVTDSFDHCFKDGASSLGWPVFMPLQELRDMPNGFVVDGKLIVTTRMKLLVPSSSHAIANEAVAAAS